MRSITELELFEYRNKVGMGNYILLMVKLKDCSICEEFSKVFELVEKIFPEIEFCYLEIEEPKKIPLFASPSSPSIYLFIDGMKIMEHNGDLNKTELKNLIKSWVLG